MMKNNPGGYGHIAQVLQIPNNKFANAIRKSTTPENFVKIHLPNTMNNMKDLNKNQHEFLKNVLRQNVNNV